MRNSFRIKKHMNLTAAEQLIYALLSCYSNRHGKSNVTREWLAKQSGIKKLDTITKHTNRLQELGLIRKTYHIKDGKKLAEYFVLNPSSDFMWISNDLCHLKPGLISFLIKLAEYRWGTTDTVRLSNNELIKLMHVSKSTFHRYKNELIQDGLIVINSEGIQINTHFFPTFLSVPKELKDFDKQMEENANIDSDFKGSRIYTTYH